mmetsp:Transcript_11786/g.23834  ORF Transcript_11786/g.23834 Transcript_11786/m.23834 type:complete len:106 (-) Transcript_11786:387-704(-)
MSKSVLFTAILSLALVVTNAFKPGMIPTQRFRHSTKTQVVPAFLESIMTIAADSTAYGSVNAPAWVLPAGAVAVILTAAVPILLKPGEEALDQMREDEDGKTNFR